MFVPQVCAKLRDLGPTTLKDGLDTTCLLKNNMKAETQKACITQDQDNIPTNPQPTQPTPPTMTPGTQDGLLQAIQELVRQLQPIPQPEPPNNPAPAPMTDAQKGCRK